MTSFCLRLHCLECSQILKVPDYLEPLAVLLADDICMNLEG